MKAVSVQQARLGECLKDAQRDRVLITRTGKPFALIMGVAGLDLEQIELGHSDKFWKLVRKWRRQKTINREELDKHLGAKTEHRPSNAR